MCCCYSAIHVTCAALVCTPIGAPLQDTRLAHGQHKTFVELTSGAGLMVSDSLMNAMASLSMKATRSLSLSPNNSFKRRSALISVDLLFRASAALLGLLLTLPIVDI